MTVSNSWLVNVSVGINTTAVQSPDFNKGMLIGVMPTQSLPYQSPPDSWGGEIFKVYSSASKFTEDFAPLLAGAITAGDTAQINRFTWLSDAVSAYFSQNPSPLTLTISAMGPPTSLTSYTQTLSQIATATNDWYGFSICDNIPVQANGGTNVISKIVMTIVFNSPGTLVAGTELKSLFVDSTQPYLLAQDFIVSVPGTYPVTFYCVDTVTVIPPGSFTEIGYNDETPPIVTSVINEAENSIVSIPVSIVTISVTNTAPVFIRAGSISIGTSSPTSPYLLLSEVNLTTTGTFQIPFYSLDTVTNIGIGAQNLITYNSVSFPALTTPQTNAAGNVVVPAGAPGILTPGIGVVAALANLRTTSNNNPKKLFLDTNDPAVAGQVQTGGGSNDLLINYHALNLQASTALVRASLSAACLSAYFTNLFNLGIGMKPYSSMQLAAGTVPIDTTITTANIGDVKNAGSSSNLIGWTNNVYAGIGAPPGIGLMQYGLMTSSITGTNSKLVYLDQVVGADFIQLTSQADLFAFILSQQPFGGVTYDNYGIQQLVSVFKGSIQKAVDQNILQPPPNSAFVYSNYAQIPTTDISKRIYKDMYFNGNFLSRIQRIAVNINLSL